MERQAVRKQACPADFRGGLRRNPCRNGVRVLVLKTGAPKTITYDREVDALYIRFTETTVLTKELGEGIAADFDADGRLAGLEILDAAERLGGSGTFRRVTLEDIAISLPVA